MARRREHRALDRSPVRAPVDEAARGHCSASRAGPERPAPRPDADGLRALGCARVKMNAPELEHAGVGMGAHRPLRLVRILGADGGHEQVQEQIPALTRNAATHDILIVADESGLFGDYLPYRTWDARPVAGTQGLVPVGWHPALEQWGATQIQNRFRRLANRTMRPLDYDAWVAVRSIGEAAIRNRSVVPAQLIAYLKSADFDLAAHWKTATTTYQESLPRYDVTLRVEPRAAAWLKQWRSAWLAEPMGAPDTDGWITCRVNFDCEDEACYTVLGFGHRRSADTALPPRSHPRRSHAGLESFLGTALGNAQNGPLRNQAGVSWHSRPAHR